MNSFKMSILAVLLLIANFSYGMDQYTAKLYKAADAQRLCDGIATIYSADGFPPVFYFEKECKNMVANNLVEGIVVRARELNEECLRASVTRTEEQRHNKNGMGFSREECEHKYYQAEGFVDGYSTKIRADAGLKF